MLIATLALTSILMKNYLNLLILRFFDSVNDVNKEKIAFRHSFWLIIVMSQYKLIMSSKFLSGLLFSFFFFFIMPLHGRQPSWCNVKSKFLNIIQSFESGYLFSIIFRGFFCIYMIYLQRMYLSWCHWLIQVCGFMQNGTVLTMEDG